MTYLRGLGCLLGLGVSLWLGFPDWYPAGLRVVAFIMFGAGIALAVVSAFKAVRENRTT